MRAYSIIGPSNQNVLLSDIAELFEKFSDFRWIVVAPQDNDVVAFCVSYLLLFCELFCLFWWLALMRNCDWRSRYDVFAHCKSVCFSGVAFWVSSWPSFSLNIIQKAVNEKNICYIALQNNFFFVKYERMVWMRFCLIWVSRGDRRLLNIDVVESSFNIFARHLRYLSDHQYISQFPFYYVL